MSKKAMPIFLPDAIHYRD